LLTNGGKIAAVEFDVILKEYPGNTTAQQMVKIMAEGGGRQKIIDYLNNDSNPDSDVRRTIIKIRNL
jgi:hypothetical protein